MLVEKGIALIAALVECVICLGQWGFAVLLQRIFAFGSSVLLRVHDHGIDLDFGFNWPYAFCSFQRNAQDIHSKCNYCFQIFGSSGFYFVQVSLSCAQEAAVLARESWFAN